MTCTCGRARSVRFSRPVTRQFATTQWNIVLAARDGNESQARLALGSLCEAYWFPLYAYVRQRGHPADEARDLTQAFFADLLSRDFLSGIDRSKGRFRSFLLASLEHFLSHERDKARALKNGGAVQIGSLDADLAETRYGHEPTDQLTPELVFERRWGLTVMERAMDRLHAESRDQSERFEHFKACLTGDNPERYREIARSLGMTENAVKTAVHRLRERYGRLLRDEVAETVATSAEVDEEVRYLLSVIRPWQDREM
jgi:DNA-directed RNA polymerase specialized sigma24 family protein